MLGKLFKKTKYIQLKPEEMRAAVAADKDQSLRTFSADARAQVPDGLYLKCKSCGTNWDHESFESSNGVCPVCGHHHRLKPEQRIDQIMDAGSFVALFEDVLGNNPLGFPQYDEKLAKEQEKNQRTEAVLVGTGRINGFECAIGVMDPSFMMGSMGVAVGERITRIIEHADQHKLPLIILTASGGARMQEGIFSLMQMAKTSIALSQFGRHGGLYISILTDPTTGGVTASFAMLGDLILAEPKALIGFAGPRVIEQTIRQKLPEGFQTSEFLLEHGFIDHIVPREKMAGTLANLIHLHGGRRYEA